VVGHSLIEQEVVRRAGRGREPAVGVVGRGQVAIDPAVAEEAVVGRPCPSQTKTNSSSMLLLAAPLLEPKHAPIQSGPPRLAVILRVIVLLGCGSVAGMGVARI
jgi:hypothetical protein